MVEILELYRGDDSDFVLNQSIYIKLETELDISQCAAHIRFYDYVQDFCEIPQDRKLTLVFPAEQTREFPLGLGYAKIWLTDAQGKIRTVGNDLRIRVTKDIDCLSKHDISYSIIPLMDYNELKNRPQINGKTLEGDKTPDYYGIHSIPSGGTDGQALVKDGDQPYAVKWSESGSGRDGNAVHYTADTGKSAEDKGIARANIGAQAEISDLSAIRSNAQAGATHAASRNNPHGVTKAQVGLGNVDNTSDSAKPISDAASARFSTIDQSISSLDNGKVDKVQGKGLSESDFTTAEKTKLSGIAAGAEVNVINGVKVNGTDQPVTDKKVNIPVPTALADLTGDATHRTVTDAEKQTWGGKRDQNDRTWNPPSSYADYAVAGKPNVRLYCVWYTGTMWCWCSREDCEYMDFHDGDIYGFVEAPYISPQTPPLSISLTKQVGASPVDYGDGTKVTVNLALTTEIPTAAEKAAWNAKQNALTDPQLAAANSGVTAAKVSTYDGYAAQIAGKRDLTNRLWSAANWDLSQFYQGTFTTTAIDRSGRGTAWILYVHSTQGLRIGAIYPNSSQGSWDTEAEALAATSGYYIDENAIHFGNVHKTSDVNLALSTELALKRDLTNRSWNYNAWNLTTIGYTEDFRTSNTVSYEYGNMLVIEVYAKDYSVAHIGTITKTENAGWGTYSELEAAASGYFHALASGLTSGTVTKIQEQDVFALQGEIPTIDDFIAWYEKYDKPSGGIPSSDMASVVQTTLAAVPEKYEKPDGGIPSTDMTEEVQATLAAVSGKVSQINCGSMSPITPASGVADVSSLFTSDNASLGSTIQAKIDATVGTINTALDTLNGEVA